MGSHPLNHGKTIKKLSKIYEKIVLKPSYSSSGTLTSMGVQNCINICCILWVHWIGAYMKNFSVSQQMHVEHVRLLIISKGSYFCLSPYLWTLQTKVLFALQVWIVILIIAAPPICCIISCFWGCRTSISLILSSPLLRMQS